MPSGFLTQTTSPFSYFPLVTSGSGRGLSSTPFIRTWYLCSTSAGAEQGETSSIDVVPIDRLQYWTILSGCDSLNGPMTSFYNSISIQWVSTLKLQMHVPIPHKFSKVFTSGCSVVGQYFHRRALLKENILQLLDNSRHILSAQWPPYCKSRGARVDDS